MADPRSVEPLSPADPKRIGILTTSYPTFEGDPSGQFVEAHALELVQAGEDVTVLAMGEPRSPANAKLSTPTRAKLAAPDHPSVRIEWMGGARLFGWPGATARLAQVRGRALHALVPSLRMAERTRRFERLIAHWIVPCAWPIAWLARLASPSRELEVWAHGADVRLLTARPRLARAAFRALLSAPRARFVFVSGSLRDATLELLDTQTADALRSRSRVQPAPIRIPPRESLSDPRRPNGSSAGPARLAPPGQDGYVVWVGRPIAGKRPEIAVRSAASARVQIVMVGITELDVAPACRALGAAFLGRLTRPETLRWIAHASALVSTSEAEGASTVVREARALGVRVIALPAGDLEDAAARDAGIRLARDEAHLAACLEHESG